MKKNIIIKFSIIICILIFGFSFFYYFTKYLPEKEKKRLEKECFELGQKIYTQDEERFKESKSIIIFSPIYKYNAELKTCLYSGGTKFYDQDTVSWNRFIKDAYTNLYLAIINVDDTKKIDEEQTKAIEDFNNQIDKYFGRRIK